MRRINHVLPTAWLLLVLTGARAHAAGIPVVELLQPGPTATPQRTEPNSGVRRARLVGINREALSALSTRLPAPARLSLFDDTSFEVLLSRFEAGAAGSRTWFGHLIGHPFSGVVIVETAGLVTASIHPRPGLLFDLYPLDDSRSLAREIDPRRLGGCGGFRTDPTATSSTPSPPFPRATAQADSPALPPPGCDDGSVIDILIVYTPAARSAAGGTSAITALAHLAVADANAAFDRSLIDTHLRLVHTQELNYAETNNPDADAACLINRNDNCLEEVHTLRDLYGADCVSLWVNSYGGAGFGYFPHPSFKPIGASGFTFMGYQGASGLTLAHEIGHNLWCAHDHLTHDMNEPNDVPFADYSFGYREPGNAWHDIMAYDPGVALPYFANPAVFWPGPDPPHPGPLGVPAGQPGAADLALTINQTRLIVANFRPTFVPGLPAVLHVRRDAPPGGNGHSWPTALNDLRQALCLASGSGGAVKEIWVAAGTYRPDRGSNDRRASIALVNNLAVYGGFAGTETSRDQRNPAANRCTLTGDIGTIGASADNAFHVVTGSGTDPTAVLDGFTISGGCADGTAAGDDGGGGLLNFPGGSPTLANCLFTGNVARNYGGAVYNCQNASPTFTNCAFTGNSSLGTDWPQGGGAVFNSDHCDPAFTGCQFAGNHANIGAGVANVTSCSPQFTSCLFTQNTTAGTNSEGGAVYSYDDCHTILTGCSLTMNSATTGGALYHHSNGSLTLADCAINGNTAAGDGGASYNYNAVAVLADRCVFANNTGAFGGAMTNLFGSSAVLTDCHFRRNHAANDAGALGTYSASPATLTNCLLLGNTTNGAGAAVANYFDSSPQLVNCTVAGNVSGWTAALYAYQSSATVANTILWDNRFGATTSEQSQVAVDQPLTIHHSTVQGWTGALGGTANNGQNPAFIDADGADNLYGTADDNPRLGSGSPAIDTADNSAIPAGVIADLDGGPRIVNAIADRGAYETVTTRPGDFDHDGDADADDLMEFQACVSGPAIAHQPGCLPMDLDHDLDVDQVDFGIFQCCYSGKDREVLSGCAS